MAQLSLSLKLETQLYEEKTTMDVDLSGNNCGVVVQHAHECIEVLSRPQAPLKFLSFCSLSRRLDASNLIMFLRKPFGFLVRVH